jgi:hypothetical protein
MDNRSRRTVGHARLYQMAAGQALAAVPAGSISILLTDPPYSTVDRHSESGHLRHWFAGSLPWPEIGKILALARGKLRPDGIAFVMTNSAGLSEALAAMTKAASSGCAPSPGTSGPRASGVACATGPSTSWWATCPARAPWRALTWWRSPRSAPAPPGRYPTEKPEGLGRKLAAIASIASIGPGDVVLDPFCGSGALLVGAKERGATVIGADIAPAALRRAAGKLGLRPSAITVPTAPAAARRPSRTPVRRTQRRPRTPSPRHG